ncbi:glycosyltransferase family 4 protein [Curvivirga aplysinae]|uniref:glycosyltransferase family 4 protein n=1 Tax=Curvivirga aplysinae TaxID=2529852 RepID=UPI0012BCEC34|nr:glycosyltransferase family 4 protein [Curvivirga aplysinae]MTI11404.1 glycosyltransferase family 1 protein [Curvivirga aplysinae]
MILTLFLTFGSSLQTWKKDGILDRELALYREHSKLGNEVHIISYGDARDIEIAANYDFFTLHCNKHNLHPRIYTLLIPILHRHVFNKSDILKTNQLAGAHIARRCSNIYSKPLVTRQGYGHYEHRVEEHGTQSAKARDAKNYEAKSYAKADLITFTTKALALRAIERHMLDKELVHVVPNYVVERTWSPAYHCPETEDTMLKLAFYGRFSEQKNLEALIEASSGLDVKLTLIGEGELEADLRQKAKKLNTNCTFIGRQTQEALKDILAENDFFILPSHYEGHPKSLIETMAFGMPIVAANSPGIKEQVVDGQTGILFETNVEAIRETLVKLTKMSIGERMILGANAREWSLSNFSVQSVSQQENNLYAGLL